MIKTFLLCPVITSKHHWSKVFFFSSATYQSKPMTIEWYLWSSRLVDCQGNCTIIISIVRRATWILVLFLLPWNAVGLSGPQVSVYVGEMSGYRPLTLYLNGSSQRLRLDGRSVELFLNVSSLRNWSHLMDSLEIILVQRRSSDKTCLL